MWYEMRCSLTVFYRIVVRNITKSTDLLRVTTINYIKIKLIKSGAQGTTKERFQLSFESSGESSLS